ncbi:hypothetical protein CAMRE0001_1794 [Campylobacter rectus RM3267]|uniref:Uncharacterized protein n=1 Tax=Campylobacter rectus RM3267 TaxID=553218 RepID=B9CYH4_CAMRE|nr:hypothetical protein CAMRE0001_1794 [Campylobacter rectus RM3267]
MTGKQSSIKPGQIKFDIFKMQVSVGKICKFDFKFERKKLRRSIVR